MRRHPFDPVSAVCGIIAVAAGLLVVLGEAADLDTGGPWWIAGAALLAGLAIIPWRRRSAPGPGRHGGPVDGEPARLAPTCTAGPLLRLDRLTKRYPGVTALDDLTVEVPRGRIGLVGANGAGKTTMFRLLLGLAHPTEGRVEVVRHRRRRRPDRRAHPARLHARARLPAARPDRGRRRRHVRRAERPAGAGGPPAGVGHPRPRRPRRGPLPPDRRLLDRHAPAHEAGPGARRRPRAGAARRADGRARPARPGGDARPRRPPRHVRHLRADGHPPARRRAAGVRPRPDDRRRPAGRRPGPTDVAARAHRAGHRRRRSTTRGELVDPPRRRGARGRPSSTDSSRSPSTATTTSTCSATSSPTSACRCTACRRG